MYSMESLLFGPDGSAPTYTNAKNCENCKENLYSRTVAYSKSPYSGSSSSIGGEDILKNTNESMQHTQI